jgi:adenine-specific DNA-methyltransferase
MSIDKIKTGDDLTQSLDIVSDNISKLKELFPEVLTEGKIDFKVLQDILGNEIEEEDEFYRFTWAGKSQSRREAHKPSTGTLRPCKEESVDWDTTQNLYIEGDNLEVLKLLQKSYTNKIKLIYIDPPYNTGSDFVYKDNYKDNLKNYQQITGQVDSEGNKMSTNSESNGRYHSNWLNMMYPRLILSRNLMKEDGFIFISIDDNEHPSLRKICNEVFGEENFVSNFIWKKKSTTSNVEGAEVSYLFDNTLCYRKSKLSIISPRIKLSETRNYNNSDAEGNYRIAVIEKKNEGGYERKTMQFEIIGHKPREGKRWQIGIDTAKELENKNRFFFDGEKVVLKIYDFEDKDTTSAQPNILEDLGSSDSANRLIKLLFNDKSVFDTPKPIELLEHFLKIIDTRNEIILDYFSGSASTAHSVMELNSQDGGNRKHIQVQLPELTEEKSEAFKSGYKTITEIGKERIRRAGKKIKEENPLLSGNLDIGFKVFKLDSSNIKGWDGLPDNLEKSLFESQDNIKSDRKEEDVLFEILLKYGLDLTLPIEEKVIEGKKVFNVGFGALFICLGNELTSKVAEGIGQWKETLKPETCRVIFKDGGFTDVEKTNSVQTLKRFGIQEIKSI